MPTNITLNPDKRITLDKPVRSIEIQRGQVQIGKKKKRFKAGSTYKAEGNAGIPIYTEEDGAALSIYYTDEPV